MIVAEAMALTAAGAVVGTAASLLLTRLMKDLLFEVTPGDPVTLRRGHRDAARRGAGGELPARPTGDESRSGRRAQGRMNVA